MFHFVALPVPGTLETTPTAANLPQQCDLTSVRYGPGMNSALRCLQGTSPPESVQTPNRARDAKIACWYRVDMPVLSLIFPRINDVNAAVLQHIGTHPLASAIGLSRSYALPPSEMKSLYGSKTSSPVSRRWNAGIAMECPYAVFA
jgi:hypothetical protein